MEKKEKDIEAHKDSAEAALNVSADSVVDHLNHHLVGLMLAAIVLGKDRVGPGIKRVKSALIKSISRLEEIEAAAKENDQEERDSTEATSNGVSANPGGFSDAKAGI